jgi:hypothetical protein
MGRTIGPVIEKSVNDRIGEPCGPIANIKVFSVPIESTLVVCFGYWYKCGCEIRGSAPFYFMDNVPTTYRI